MDAVKKLFLLLSLFLSSLKLFAQLPPQQPEQDCIHAIPVCQNIFFQPNSYQGAGKNPTEINPRNSCLLSGEQNDVWYIFTVQQAGDLCFSIIPNDSTDDYDWALFDISQAACSDIFSDPSIEVSCNYHTSMPQCGGVTGANGILNNSCAALNEACIQVQQGQSFVLNVSNFSASSAGYTLDFSSSTADIYDQNPPAISQLENNCANQWSLEFNEAVLVSSVQNTDFILRDSSGNDYLLTGIWTIDSLNSYTRSFEFTIDSMLPSGSFSLIIVDSVLDKCSQVALMNVPFTVSILSRNLSYDLPKDYYCKGEMVSLSAYSSGIISWQGNSNQSTYEGVFLNDEWITVKANFQNGCEIADSIFLDIRDVEFPKLGLDSNYCVKDTLHLSAITGDSLSNFWWEFNSQKLDAKFERDIIQDQVGTLNLELFGQLGNCPTQSQTYEIHTRPLPEFTLDINGDKCLKNNLLEININSDETIGLTYTWMMEGQQITDNAPSYSHHFGTVGPNLIQVVVTNQWNCVASVDSLIEIYPNPVFRTLELEHCLGEGVNLLLTAFTDSQLSHWKWESEALAGQDTSFTIPALTGNERLVKIRGINQFGCKDSSVSRIGIRALPQGGLMKNEFCQTENIFLENTNKDVKSSWYLDQTKIGEGSQLALGSKLPGSYMLEILLEDSFGCTNEVTQELNIRPQAFIELIFDDTSCMGNDVEFEVFTNEEGLSYHWNEALRDLGNGIWSFDNIQADLELEVFGIDSMGCQSNVARGKIEVLRPEEVSISISSENLTLPNALLNGKAISNWPHLSYEWQMGDGKNYSGDHISHLYEREGIFKLGLKIRLEGVCEIEKEQVEITVERGNLPRPANAFSPNNDGINDYWTYNGPLSGQTEIHIFNRWGKEVYQSSGSKISWDGKSLSSSPQPSGVYVYKLLIINSNGTSKEITGSISLIR
ncbi:MAG: gliding motility-associated C-terminal domain-containing protein [Bacteroidia bacterium]|nr:gliding motility-associated C-terminal domain-containing protein [Bacteroidia bacterium]